MVCPSNKNFFKACIVLCSLRTAQQGRLVVALMFLEISSRFSILPFMRRTARQERVAASPSKEFCQNVHSSARFVSCTAEETGGGLYVTKFFQENESYVEFKSCTAVRHGGGLYAQRAGGRSHFAGCTSWQQGGGGLALLITVIASDLHLRELYLMDNTASDHTGWPDSRGRAASFSTGSWCPNRR